MNIDSVIIETTRRCNLTCEHCLRGDMQPLDMSPDIINAFFSKIDSSYVSTITFTGGEPSLNPVVIDYCIKAAKKHNVSFGSFYIATNGQAVSDDFLKSVLNLYCFCNDNEYSQLQLSNDIYHQESEQEKRLSAFSFYSKRFDETFNGKHIIQEGNALWNGLDGRELKLSPYLIDEGDIQEGEVYINCLGNIICDCNLSYENQDNPFFILGNVQDSKFDLFKAVKKFNKLYKTKLKGKTVNDIINA